MNDEQVLRKAVTLADGWEIDTGFGKEWLTDPSGHGVHFPPENQWMLDALAAQLVRQVESSGDNYDYGFFSVSQFCDAGQFVTEVLAEDGTVSLSVVIGPDRTMNTLKAIVESGVLE